jgi:DNA-binding NarL/FixJ family response regulator
MFFKTKTLTLREAELRFKRAGALTSTRELRPKIPIVAIDDQVFPPEKNLHNSGFRIETLTDIQRIADIEAYPIVLCDVNGIGTALSVDTQGAYVIEEIKAAYPDKVVIAYTAGSAAQKLVVRAKSAADAYIRKDATVDEWRDLLDNQIEQLSNPIAIWRKTRSRLLEQEIELSELLKIEQAVLKNIGNGAQSVREAVELELRNEPGQPLWKSELGKFLGSKAFDLAFAYVFTPT